VDECIDQCGDHQVGDRVDRAVHSSDLHCDFRCPRQMMGLHGAT
jgi:hypothetical protein